VSIDSNRFSAERFHQLIGDRFGWNILRSNSYGMQLAGNRVRFSGFGHGHGVGMCQAGAEERGKAGHSYQSILAFYYPGTILGVAASGLRWSYATGERVNAFAVDPPSARELASAADDALRQAESISGFSAAKRPLIRSYPSLAIYRDATGSGGHVAATASGFIIRMQPIGILRSRGVLRSTLVHEMLHVLIDSHAHQQLPDWFREGVTLYLSATGPSGNPAQGLRGDYAKAVARVRRLADRHGRSTLLNWVRLGIPPEVLTPDAAPRTRTAAAPPR
jgi:stage II sporulation protein D